MFPYSLHDSLECGWYPLAREGAIAERWRPVRPVGLIVAVDVEFRDLSKAVSMD
jgi:hypothetical protein